MASHVNDLRDKRVDYKMVFVKQLSILFTALLMESKDIAVRKSDVMLQKRGCTVSCIWCTIARMPSHSESCRITTKRVYEKKTHRDLQRAIRYSKAGSQRIFEIILPDLRALLHTLMYIHQINPDTFIITKHPSRHHLMTMIYA